MNRQFKKVWALTFLVIFLLIATSQSLAAQLIQAKVVKVSDGDTIHVLMAGKNEKVRLIGVNTPEIAHPELGIKEQVYGKAATAYTYKRLYGKQVWIQSDVQPRDKYHRLLAYIWLQKPKSYSLAEVKAKMYNAELVANGYAQLMTIAPNVKYALIFKNLQREARKNGRGLWAHKIYSNR